MNTVNFNDAIGSSGQKIPIKASDKLVGDVEFVIYTPCNVISDYRVDNVWLKDFKIDLIKPITNKPSDTDTEYLNVINTNFVNEFSEISEKVQSNTNKGLNYSVVIDKPTDLIGYRNNEKLCTKTLGINQKQEYNTIQKYVNQYSSPKKILNLTLDNSYYPFTLFDCSLFSTDKYIVSKMSIDYFNDNNTVTIVEKI